jgi:hypothetical protein
MAAAAAPPPHHQHPHRGPPPLGKVLTLGSEVIFSLLRIRDPVFFAVLRIHEILVRIRIRGSIPLTNGCGFGSGYFRQ